MEWNIKPNAGLGPLRFGMSREDVAAFNGSIGAVETIDAEFDGSVNERRGLEAPVCNYVQDRLAAIGTSWRVPGVVYDGLDVYGADPAEFMIRLCDAGAAPQAGLGFIIFPELGINTIGFFDSRTGRYTRREDLPLEDERAVTIFSAGTYDGLKDEFVPIELPRYV